MDAIAPSSRRRPTVAAIVMIVAVMGVMVVTSSAPGSAQAAFVNASVRTVPALPQPGQTVQISVRVTGCPPGTTDVEVLQVADLPAGVAGGLMVDAPARTSLLWRTRAQIQMTNAIQGWYGIRVQCGTYRPAQVPLANTTFAVGAVPQATMTLGARTVSAGGSVPISGTHCPGPSVDYEVVGRDHYTDEFTTTASIPTQADGGWSGQITIPPDFTPGPVFVRARCAVANQIGTTVDFSYGAPLDLRIEPPS